MRQYYDIYNLLEVETVQAFIGTEAYFQHKEERFSNKDKETSIIENQAFLISNHEKRLEFKKRYEATSRLYYKSQPPFEELLQRILEHLHKL